MVELVGDYFVEVDSYSYTLKRRGQGVSKKTNEPIITETVIGYYPSLKLAIEGAKDHCIREFLARDKFTLIEAIRLIERIDEEFTKILNERIKE